VVFWVEGDDLARPVQGLGRSRSNRVQLPDKSLAGAVGGRQRGPSVDAPDDPSDLLILPTVASLGSRSFPVAVMGGFWIVVPAATLATASSSTASAATAVAPRTATSALATRGTVTSDVPGSAAVVAAVLTDPVSSALLPDGEILERTAILEQVVTF